LHNSVIRKAAENMKKGFLTSLFLIFTLISTMLPVFAVPADNETVTDESATVVEEPAEGEVSAEDTENAEETPTEIPAPTEPLYSEGNAFVLSELNFNNSTLSVTVENVSENTEFLSCIVLEYGEGTFEVPMNSQYHANVSLLEELGMHIENGAIIFVQKEIEAKSSQKIVFDASVPGETNGTLPNITIGILSQKISSEHNVSTDALSNPDTGFKFQKFEDALNSSANKGAKPKEAEKKKSFIDEADFTASDAGILVGFLIVFTALILISLVLTGMIFICIILFIILFVKLRRANKKIKLLTDAAEQTSEKGTEKTNDDTDNTSNGPIDAILDEIELTKTTTVDSDKVQEKSEITK